jgi:hypothetical protein
MLIRKGFRRKSCRILYQRSPALDRSNAFVSRRLVLNTTVGRLNRILNIREQTVLTVWLVTHSAVVRSIGTGLLENVSVDRVSLDDCDLENYGDTTLFAKNAIFNL